MSRRYFAKIFLRSFLVVSAASVLFLGYFLFIERAGGAFDAVPNEKKLSPAARGLIKRAYRNIDVNRLRDYHVHVVGLGRGGSGLRVNRTYQSFFHSPRRYLMFRLYVSASGIRNTNHADSQYIARLVRLTSRDGMRGKIHLLAFDARFTGDGAPDWRQTEFYAPNEYVMRIAGEHPDRFAPTVSVHPYRKDAPRVLEDLAKRGARLVKWLPNAMGIDPSDCRLDEYYAVMRKYKMTLLAHAGEEAAVGSHDTQHLGNPLLLRRPLAKGVRVMVAHAASLGRGRDRDDVRAPRADNFRLFMRMMDNPRWKGLLFGEISAITLLNRAGYPLRTLLMRTDLHPRLRNGSDYPLPAMNIAVHTSYFARRGFISREERKALNEIYRFNPLLFDFVLKRVLRHPDHPEKRFGPEVFMLDPKIGL